MQKLFSLLLAIASFAPAAIVIENREVRLELSEDGHALSLRHKRSGAECLAPGAQPPMFAAM